MNLIEEMCIWIIDCDIQRTYVNVEPELVLFTDVGHIVDRIKRTEYSRARGSCHQEWTTTFRQALRDLLLQIGYYHFSSATQLQSHNQSISQSINQTTNKNYQWFTR